MNAIHESRIHIQFGDNVKQREIMMFVRIATHFPVFALSIALIVSFGWEKIAMFEGLKGPSASECLF